MQTLHSHSLHGRPSAGPGRVSQKQLQPPNHAMHLLGRSGVQQRQRLLGLTRVEPSSTSSTSTNAHRSAVSLHQRQGGSPDHSHHGQHVSHHHRQLRDDGSLKVRLATVEAAAAGAAVHTASGRCCWGHVTVADGTYNHSSTAGVPAGACAAPADCARAGSSSPSVDLPLTLLSSGSTCLSSSAETDHSLSSAAACVCCRSSCCCRSA